MSRQKITWIRLALVLALPLMSFTFGCTGGKSQISGTVTYKGNPLPGGSIVFRAADGKEYGSSIDNNGKYFVDKVPTGNMKVYFNIPPANLSTGPLGVPKEHEQEMKDKMKAPPGAPPEAQKAYQGVGAKTAKIPQLPAKYLNAEDTPLSFEVKSGSNTNDITLTD
ncbi:MAG TPA: carboxypeptidase-like regulatory domain-containing protein [Gemmataceae bacterium]|jgi:hypothetical protein|nr:carboxypeptidase-like regulatory domain-containing protein [Gemmataceae bacterium]